MSGYVQRLMLGWRLCCFIEPSANGLQHFAPAHISISSIISRRVLVVSFSVLYSLTWEGQTIAGAVFTLCYSSELEEKLLLAVLGRQTGLKSTDLSQLFPTPKQKTLLSVISVLWKIKIFTFFGINCILIVVSSISCNNALVCKELFIKLFSITSGSKLIDNV